MRKAPIVVGAVLTGAFLGYLAYLLGGSAVSDPRPASVVAAVGMIGPLLILGAVVVEQYGPRNLARRLKQVGSILLIALAGYGFYRVGGSLGTQSTAMSVLTFVGLAGMVLIVVGTVLQRRARS